MPEESWYIISGKAYLVMYDTDGTHIGAELLKKGEISFTFNGAGHNYRVKTNNFFCLEYKVGPYLGVEADKVFL